MALSCSSFISDSMQMLARFELREQRLEGRQFVLLVFALGLGTRFFQRFLEPLDAAGDDLHIGQQKIFVEPGDVGQRIAAGRMPRRPAPGSPPRESGQPGGVALVRAAQAGRVDQFQRRPA